MHVIGQPPPEVCNVGCVGHQPACLCENPGGVNSWQMMPLSQVNDQLTMSTKASRADQDCVSALLGGRGEAALDFERSRFAWVHLDQRDTQCCARLSQSL